ncbi:MAG: amidase [SAR324 cluster bacterium]|nr:amidase [SAR324 cluster bacterium]
MTANFLSAREAIQAIHGGEITSEELVQACLDRIAEQEETVGAWAHLDPEYALAQARDADDNRQRGMPLGALHGIPVGIKDIFDTADLPTELGTPLHAGRTPSTDAAVVEKLREAGAVILGKTVTTELAVFSPGKTANPLDPARTPGGSSSGSAAAVASCMVPLAVGSQTNGSVIRPASFCGVFGFKPTFGRISRYRVLLQSPVLDTVGVFARGLADLALISDVLMEFDSRDKSMRPRARMGISGIMADPPPMEPHLAFVRSPVWDQAEESSKDAFRELIAVVEEQVDIVELPSSFGGAHEIHRQIMEADLAKNFAREYRDGKDKLSTELCGMIERGQKVTAVQYNGAIEQREEFNEGLNEVFDEYDAILTPAAPGEAPVGLDSTGNPAFCTIWTLCGVPALTMPLLQGPADMPIGVQLVGARGDDGRLFRTANWLVDALHDES